MTLDTRIYVLDEVSPYLVFLRGQELLAEKDEHGRVPKLQESYVKRRHDIFEEPDTYEVANRIGQGLPAILEVIFRLDEPYRTVDDAAQHKEWCNLPDSSYFDPTEPHCNEVEHDVPCWLEISLDTAYSYRGPNGIGCGELHAWMILQLGTWLNERNVRWKWRNEFTGEVHEGYDRLVELCAGGDKAADWLREIFPAVVTHALTHDEENPSSG